MHIQKKLFTNRRNRSAASVTERDNSSTLVTDGNDIVAPLHFLNTIRLSAAESTLLRVVSCAGKKRDITTARGGGIYEPPAESFTTVDLFFKCGPSLK
jgi:hypothetical protein